MTLELGRLGLGERRRLDHDQLAFGRLGRQRGAQRELADLLRQVGGVAAHDRTEGLAAAAELRRRLVAVAGAGRCPSGRTSSWPSPSSSARPLVLCVPCWRRDSCHTTQRCRMSLRTGSAEHRIGEIDLAGAVALDGLDRDLHDLILKPAARRRPPEAPRGPRLRRQPCAGRPGTAHPCDGRAWTRP